MPNRQPFEFTEHEGKRCILARGRTRAGLYTAAMQGVFALMKPAPVADRAERVERSFALEAESAEHLLARMMNEIITIAHAQGETCEEIKFTLVTDKKAEGSFTNCSKTSYGAKAGPIRGEALTISKNGTTGEWEAVICVE